MKFSADRTSRLAGGRFNQVGFFRERFALECLTYVFEKQSCWFYVLQLPSLTLVYASRVIYWFVLLLAAGRRLSSALPCNTKPPHLTCITICCLALSSREISLTDKITETIRYRLAENCEASRCRNFLCLNSDPTWRLSTPP